MFARLADVRNDLEGRERETPLAEPKGLPLDVGQEMKSWWDGDEGFSASWFGLEELARHEWGGYAFMDEIIERCRAIAPLEELRVVFWFSS